MKAVLVALVTLIRSSLRGRVALQLEILALRHQLAVYRRRRSRVRIQVADRLLWAWLSPPGTALVFVQPSTVIAWQRRRFRDHWARLSRSSPGRPAVAKEVRDLIRNMSMAKPTWGSPRIVGELAKLGIQVAKATVEKYRVRPRKPPSPTWRTFLESHIKELVSVDFFVVPTVTFKILFVFVVLSHPRRRVVHFNVTASPTARWTAQQISEAFPWEAAPRFMVRDRDSAPVSLAERLCGAAYRHPPSGVPRSRRRAQRGALASTVWRLPGPLPPMALSPLSCHGLP